MPITMPRLFPCPKSCGPFEHASAPRLLSQLLLAAYRAAGDLSAAQCVL